MDVFITCQLLLWITLRMPYIGLPGFDHNDIDVLSLNILQQPVAPQTYRRKVGVYESTMPEAK